jgi:adenylyltransferase/sulfurtransferase
MRLTSLQLKLYQRNISIPQIGKKGQEKLLNSKVLIVGLGGLGSSCAYYLTCAGIGKLGLVDFDIVKLDNLQRQILHTFKDLERKKTDSAQEKLKKINPKIELDTYSVKLNKKNVKKIAKNYDCILECTDNFPTKYLLNEIAVNYKKPLFSASVLRFEGQAITVLPKKSACLRCAFPKIPKKGQFLSPQEAGILGSIAGILGLIQSLEAIKYLLSIGELLTDKILLFDGLNLEFKKISVRRRPDCPVCGISKSRRRK